MKKSISLLLLLFVTTIIYAQQNISGTIENPEHVKWLVLKENYGTKSRTIAKTQLSQEGNFSLLMPDSMPFGMYRIVYNLRENRYFDFIYSGHAVRINFNAHPDYFEIDFASNTVNNWYYTTLKKLFLEENQLQVLNQFVQNYTATDALKEQAIAQYNYLVAGIESKFIALKAENKYPLALPFVLAQQRYYPAITNHIYLQQDNLKQHFFNYLNPNDKTLMASAFFTDKVFEYIGILRDEQTVAVDYIIAIDKILKWAKPNEVLTAMLVDFLAKGFQQFDMPKVLEHIDVNYKAKQCESDKDAALQNRLAAYERLAIGNKAPDFSWVNASGKTQKLYKQDANYYVIAFWGSWCGACEAVLPSVNNYLAERTDVMPIAIGLDTDAQLWQQAKEKHTAFTHIRAAEKWDNTIVENYAIYATPTFYVLDKKQLIIGKAKNLIELKELF